MRGKCTVSQIIIISGHICHTNVEGVFQLTLKELNAQNKSSPIE